MTRMSGVNLLDGPVLSVSAGGSRQDTLSVQCA